MAVFAYFFTVFFNIAQAKVRWEEAYDLTLAELILQASLVILAGVIAHFFVSERKNERLQAEENEAKTQKKEELSREQIRVFAKELGKLGNDTKGELLILKKAISQTIGDDKLPYDMDRLFSMEDILGSQLTDLKDFSDMISDNIDIRDEVYEIIDLLEQTRPEKGAEGPRSSVDLVIDIDPMTPKAMVGDREKIIKILRHLILNAFRYTEEGGILVRVFTRFHADECNLCIEVTDTGIGIEKNELERLIRQIDERRTAGYRPGGLGMGLYLVSGFVRAMDGFFKIESKWGEGTQVSISIPQRVSDAVPCMSYDRKSGICVVYEDRMNQNNAVSGFYEDLFRHLTEKLDIPAYAVKNEEEIKTLIDAYPKVCLFVEQSYYEAAVPFYESLKDVYLIILANREVSIPEGSIAHIQHKPTATSEILHAIGLAAKTGNRRRRRDDNLRADKTDLKIPVESLIERRIRQTGIRKVMIVTDSMSDMPFDISRKRGIPVIPFRIFTERASFLDDTEISQEGALKYMEDHPGLYSNAPDEEEFRIFFEKNLRFAENIIYISTSKKVSVAYERAIKVAEKMKNVTVVNSGQVSGGVALMAIKADEQARMGKNTKEIFEYIESIRPKIKTSFLIDNLDHLAYVGRVNKAAARIMRSLMFHPVMSVKHDVMIPVGGYTGSMTGARETYIHKTLKKIETMDKSCVFTSSIGMNDHFLKELEQQLMTEGYFDEVISRHTCASISVNCGTDAFGIVYIEK